MVRKCPCSPFANHNKYKTYSTSTSRESEEVWGVIKASGPNSNFDINTFYYFSKKSLDMLELSCDDFFKNCGCEKSRTLEKGKEAT